MITNSKKCFILNGVTLVIWCMFGLHVSDVQSSVCIFGWIPRYCLWPSQKRKKCIPMDFLVSRNYFNI